MAKTKTVRRPSINKPSSARTIVKAPTFDGAYLLKLVLYMIIGSLWLKITTSHGSHLALPIGFIIGLAFTLHEHFQIDRKIEYAVLLVAMLVGFLMPTYGLYLNL